MGGGDRLGNIRTQRIRQTEEAHRLKQEVMGIGRGIIAGLAAAMAGNALQAPGHRQHPQALGGQPVGGLKKPAGSLRLQVAQVGDRLRSPLGRQTALALAIAPQARHHQQIGLKGILPLQRPVGMEVLTSLQVIRRQALDRQLHRIHGITAAGQHRHLQQGMAGFIEGLPRAPGFQLRPGEQPLHSHAVGREGTGFVHGEHRGTAQALHRRGPAGQHPKPRQPQRSQRQEEGQHHRNLIGQNRQGQSQARQQSAGPVTADDPLQHHEAGAHRQSQQGEPCREPAGAPLQAGGGGLHGPQAVAQPAQLGCLRHRRDRRPAPPCRHEGTSQNRLPRIPARHG